MPDIRRFIDETNFNVGRFMLSLRHVLGRTRRQVKCYMSYTGYMTKGRDRYRNFVRRWLMALTCALCGLSPARGADFNFFGPNTQAKLLLSAEAAKPGETITAGIHLRMGPDWHTYWVNPGDSGMPTKINWTLPAGVTAGEIQWPIPETFAVGGLTTYVYHDDVVLVVPLTLANDLKPGRLEIKAKVS